MASLLGLLVPIFLPSSVFAGVTISEVHGRARVRRPNQYSWNEVPANYVLSPGDQVKTDSRSSVTLTFDDGSRVELGPDSSYTLEEAKTESSFMSLSFGSLKAWVTHLAARRFSVRTPTAVCAVRGTEFGVNVAQNGNTQVALFQGLLGVQDHKGNEILLHPGQTVGVGLNGIGRPETLKAQKSANSTSERDALKNEVGLQMSKEQVLAAAAEEIKQAVYQQGKVMTDVNGYRVRLEEYILRPAPNQFKFVTLNERQGRFDYFFRTGTFNTTLPDDLSTALKQLPGCISTACQYYLTGYETGYSNTQDTVDEVAS
ncbi:MAG: FecR domain-containing protein, partial [Elusimicrobia bacterium]|nr:FecR domain-containing protein [Elusimicrobiota bacterium]